MARKRNTIENSSRPLEKTESTLPYRDPASAAKLGQLRKQIASLKQRLRDSEAFIDTLQNFFHVLGRRVERRVSRTALSDPQSIGHAHRLRTLLDYQRAGSIRLFLFGPNAIRPRRLVARRRAFALWLRYLFLRPSMVGELTEVMASGFFDASYYKSQLSEPDLKKDPLLHYLDVGAADGLDPSPLFSTTYYIRCNPDVVAAGFNPLVHFATKGLAEGRLPRRTATPATILGNWKPPARAKGADASLKKARSRCVVYTAITGDYDRLLPLERARPNLTFVALCDRPIEAKGWQVRPLNYLHHDPTRAARFAKLHPHFFFPDYDFSIWLDGNVEPRGNLRSLLSTLDAESYLAMFEHPMRDCIYAEGEECIRAGRDDGQMIRDQLANYRHEEFPEHAGLWETNVLVRRHRDPGCIALMSAWWRELELGSRRDQISLPVVAKRYAAPIAALAERGISARDHALFSVHPHAKPTRPERVGWTSVGRRPVATDQLSVTIGVCVHNNPADTKRCLQSVVSTRRPQDRIIVVDDGSHENTSTMLERFASTYPNTELVRHEDNLGYTASANVILEKAAADWLVLLNSDAVLSKGALQKLVACGEQFECIGIVGPLSNAASWQSVPEQADPGGDVGVNDLPPGMSVDDMDKLCADAASGLVPFVPLVNGFCMAIRRAVIERVGLFDKDNFPIGYGEEDDYCLRAADANFVCAVATDTYVHHMKSGSFTSARRKILAAAGAKALRDKYSAERIAASIEMLLYNPELARVRQRIATSLQSRRPKNAVVRQMSNANLRG